MNRRLASSDRRCAGKAGAPRPHRTQLVESPAESLADWRAALLDRRSFLVRLAGGSLAALFGAAGAALAGAGDRASAAPLPLLSEPERWAIIDAVQRRLFPTEPQAPGAAEIHALAYLQTALRAVDRDPGEGEFVLQGAQWLEQLAGDPPTPFGRRFLAMDGAAQERLLRRIAASEAGENWLSTLLVHILEALLTDPIYGGNPGGIGWAWLRHTPGFPGPRVPYWQLPWIRA